MNISSFGDYEWALADAISSALESLGLPVDCVPGDLPPELPDQVVQVISVGGQRLNEGVGLPGVMVHCRAKSEADARGLADVVSGVLTFLDSAQVAGRGAVIVHVGQVNVPYSNPDPTNEDLFRWSQQVTLTVKAQQV